jgi:chromosome segregation ATPase
MAPRKRGRDDADVDGEVELESASSNFRQHVPNKRSRIALARENGGSVFSDDESEIDELMGEDDTISPSQQGSDSDDDQADILDLQATQAVQKEMRFHRDNMAAEQGVIEEIFCRNFMCHSKLRIKLGPLINFIIGHNGSGKSAVLAALTMCLGGKAATTNRGVSLKKLIKEGEDSATLAVKIKNQGEGAYRPEIYGRSITIERHFTRAGTSGFKLKNEQDKIISTKKADLDDIMDFYAFQLDNPINVLSQDLARQFLANSTASDKYKFFIKGTQLEALDLDYQIMEEHLDNIEVKLATRQHDIEALKQQMDQAEERKKRLERTASIQEKIDRLRWQHAWAQVEEQERILEQSEAHTHAAAEKVRERTEAAETVDGAYEGHNQAYEAHRSTLHNFQEQLQPASEAHKNAKADMDAIKEELAKVLAEQRECKEEMKKLTKTIGRLENDIPKEHELLAEAEGAEHVDRLARLEDLRGEAEAKKEEQTEHGNAFTDLQARRAEAVRATDEGKRPVDQRREALEKAETRLRSLEQNQGRQWSGYRPHMEDLVRAINRETRWRSKPVGPMASHIKLLKPQWSSQIEKTLGGSGDAFIVTSKEDQTLLSQVMRRVNCQCPIFIGNATPLNTTGREPTEDVDTMLRVIEVDNDLVRNSLIINQGAEQTVLIADSDEAMKFMFSNPRPENVRVTMGIATDRRAGFRYEFSGRGAEKTTQVQAWDGHPRMKTDIQDQIRMQKDVVNQATRELETARSAHRRLQEAQKEAQIAITRYDRRAKELRTEVQRAEDAVEEQQNLIDASRPQDGKLQELESQLREAKQELEGQQQSYQDIVNARDDKNKQAHDRKAVLDTAHSDLEMMQKNVDKAENRLRTVESERQNALKEKNMAINLINSAKQEQTTSEEDRDAQRQRVQEYVSQAEQICARVTVPPELTADMLDQRIERLINDVTQAEREAGGTREELVSAYQQARQEYDEAEGQLSGMKKFAKVCVPVRSSFLPLYILIVE